VASQFHPEFRSRPDRPHPLFDGFVQAAIEQATKAGAPTTSEPAIATA
jgi:CTP synthase